MIHVMSNFIERVFLIRAASRGNRRRVEAEHEASCNDGLVDRILLGRAFLARNALSCELTPRQRRASDSTVPKKSPETFERLNTILTRLQAGEPGSSIARDLGVTKQYISFLKKKLQENGAEAILAAARPKRPRSPTDRPRLPQTPRGLPAYLLDTQEYERMSRAELDAMARSNHEVAQRARAAATPPARPTPVQLAPKLSRNSPCPFDPNKKFKRCCGASGATRCSQVDR